MADREITEIATGKPARFQASGGTVAASVSEVDGKAP